MNHLDYGVCFYRAVLLSHKWRPSWEGHPSCGLQQGDPLLQYLFILYMEVLFGFCNCGQDQGMLPGWEWHDLVQLSITSSLPMIRWTSESSGEALGDFEEIWGFFGSMHQLIKTVNYLLRQNTCSDQEPHQASSLYWKWSRVGIYLGLSEYFGIRKKDIFISIVDKIRLKILSWSNWFLFGSGKLGILKAVLATMPLYAMSCFKLPHSFYKHIQSSLMGFW